MVASGAGLSSGNQMEQYSVEPSARTFSSPLGSTVLSDPAWTDRRNDVPEDPNFDL